MEVYVPRGSPVPSEVFQSVMAKARKRLLLDSDDAADFEHHGIRGDERAASIAEFFRERLPDKYGVEKGEAIDSRDRRTGQIDFVIYDRAQCAPIRAGRENFLLPSEALYCVVEAKTKITKEELEKSYKAAAKVRRLRPFKKQFVPPREDGASAKDKRARCMYMIVAFSSDIRKDANWLQSEFDRMKNAAKTANAEIDCVDRLIVLDRGIINPMRPAGKWESGNGDSVFLEAYLHVVNFLGRESFRRRPVDWQMYGPRRQPGWKPLV
jgi:hypothetical protein